MVAIAPSILAADFARLGEQVQAVKDGGAELLHVDVMDGHFVPNISVGIPVVASLSKTTDLPLDCHLMIERPDDYIPAFREAGAAMISVQQEACRHLDRTLNLIRSTGAAVGVVLNPATPLETLDEALHLVDYVLIMSVNPGFGGQKFIPRSLDRIRRLAEWRDRRRLSFRIEVDGGITHKNVAEVVRAGATMIVTGVGIFQNPESGPREACERMRKLALEATLSRV
jgi:ribulose-phosphate 3-epimerase